MLLSFLNILFYLKGCINLLVKTPRNHALNKPAVRCSRFGIRILNIGFIQKKK